jgi:hypothetical protein
MTIKNIEELVKFISENFTNLSDEDYYNICFRSLGLITNKPLSVTEAIAEIKKYYDLIKDIPPGWERPLFALNENDFDD